MAEVRLRGASPLHTAEAPGNREAENLQKAFPGAPRSPFAAGVREFHGLVEHVVTVRRDDFEFEGRPYQSLSAIARQITGTRWNGWTFFGLRARGDA